MNNSANKSNGNPLRSGRRLLTKRAAAAILKDAGLSGARSREVIDGLKTIQDGCRHKVRAVDVQNAIDDFTHVPNLPSKIRLRDRMIARIQERII